MNEYKYLGVTLSNKRQTSLITHHISAILGKADRRLNCIRHFGYHSDGLRPSTGIMMYKTLVRPILEYASQVLSYRHYYFNSKKDISTPDVHIRKIEARALKKLIPCPKNTTPALLRILTGTMPIAARIDIVKLRYFWKLNRANNDNPAYSLVKYKRNNYHEPRVEFVHQVFKIC